MHHLDHRRMRQVPKSVQICAYRALGAGIAIGVMELLAGLAGQPLARVPFVTSIVLVMALPDSDAAKPSAIIAGHLICCGCGLLCFWIIGSGKTSSAFAVGIATFLMITTGTLHPPAGIDAFLVPTYELSAVWLLNAVLPGAVLLAVYGKVWRSSERHLIER